MSVRILVIGIVCIILQGCWTKPKDTVATVGSYPITTASVSERIAQLPVATQNFYQSKDAKLKLLDQMIDEEVLFQYAKKEGYFKKDDVQKKLKMAKRQIVIAALIDSEINQRTTVTDDDIKTYFDSNKVLYDAKPQRNLSHILVGSEEEAKRILAQIKKGASFEKLAETHSIDTSKANGGNLGWITADELIPDFAEVAFSLPKKGSISGVVPTEFGFHIIRVDDMGTRAPVSFEDASGSIRQTLSIKKRQELFKELIGSAKTKIKIKRDVGKLTD